MKAILFDFGGTLDTNGIHWSEYFWDAYQRLKVPVEKTLYEQAYVAAEQQLPGRFLCRSDDFSATVKAQVECQFSFLLEAGICVEPTLPGQVAGYCLTGVRTNVETQLPFLRRIARRYTLGVVSNYYGNLNASLEELGLLPVFKAAIDSTEVGVQKPNPQIFELSLEAIHSQPCETYVVGDSYERDIVPAKQLGCVTVWLRGRSWRESINTSQADYVIHSLQELSPLLRI